jgi:uncharacterized membrane protein YdjX (TVP38/TMEM64 family)
MHGAKLLCRSVPEAIMFRHPTAKPTPSSRRALPFLKAGFLLLLVLLLWRYWDHEAFLAWKNNAGPVPFFMALAILPVIGFPTTPFYLIAGATFDLPTALIGSLLALTVNLTLSYLLAHGPLRSLMMKWLARYGRELPNLEKAGHWRFTLMVKCLPGLPTFLKNSAVALADVPFPIYFAVSLVFSGFYAAGFIVLGESFLDGDYTQGIVALLALAGLAALIFILRRRKIAADGC